MLGHRAAIHQGSGWRPLPPQVSNGRIDATTELGELRPMRFDELRYDVYSCVLKFGTEAEHSLQQGGHVAHVAAWRVDHREPI